MCFRYVMFEKAIFIIFPTILRVTREEELTEIFSRCQTLLNISILLPLRVELPTQMCCQQEPLLAKIGPQQQYFGQLARGTFIKENPTT